jgi:glycine/serine hydroxymethyltransferase
MTIIFNKYRAVTPSGIRIGTAAMTARGCNKDDWIEIGGYLQRAAQITQDLWSKAEGKMDVFIKSIKISPEVQDLKKDVIVIFYHY